MINQTLAHYKITAKLGQGGMGAVYRATDTKLDREVAIKVLPESFAQDKERLARFEREAKALATLNHPNIAGIFGIEQSGDSQALILELVEGEDLSERLKRGPLPVEEALDVCKQIAEALEAAHEKGIIHRDLKPGNVKHTADGKVKVLDFGLAKVATTESTSISPDSPTITGDYTLPGTLLGTAGYMSPEQARGKAVDKRSDIWSFGVVLFECLTGKRLFTGETVTDSIGALLHQEIDWSQLPRENPPTIQLLLWKCLARDRKRRLRDIGDAVVDLEQAIADPSSSFIRLSEGALKESQHGRGMPRPLVAVTVLFACLATAALVWFLKPAPLAKPLPIRRLEVKLGVAGKLAIDRVRPAFRLSPDGSTLAFIVTPSAGSNQTRFYFRRLDSQQATPLPAADEARVFCFSPNGQSITFADATTLKSINLVTRQVSPLIDNMQGELRGIDWSDDGWIVFGQGPGLFRIPESGGNRQSLATFPAGSGEFGWPQVLPGSRAILFTQHLDTLSDHRANIMVQKLPDGKPQLLLTNAFQPHYLRSSGHLVFNREVSEEKRNLLAAPFDPESFMVGDPVAVLQDVLHDVSGTAQFDLSFEGTLVYLSGGLIQDTGSSEFEWLDRDGHREKLPLPKGNYGSFSLAPNGKRLAFNFWEWAPGRRQADIWIYEIDKQNRYRLTSDPTADEVVPVWSPDSRSVVFTSNRAQHAGLYWKRYNADQGVEPELLFDNDKNIFVFSWHGNDLAVQQQEKSKKEGAWLPADLRIIHLKGDDDSGWNADADTDFLATPGSESRPDFSRDGKWLAYASAESGTVQVYVRPFPNKSEVRGVQVSKEANGASYPRFSRTADELLYGTGVVGTDEWRIYVVKYLVDKDGTFVLENTVPWKEGTYFQHSGSFSGAPSFDVSPDGRILARKKPKAENPNPRDHLIWVQNFSQELKDRAPSTQN